MEKNALNDSKNVAPPGGSIQSGINVYHVNLHLEPGELCDAAAAALPRCCYQKAES